MWDEGRAISGGYCYGLAERPTAVPSVCGGVEWVRFANAFVLSNSDSVIYSYLAELRNIATNRQSLNHTTLARFKEVGILVGFQRVQGWNSGKVTDHATSDGEDHNLEPNLLTPDQVVIADDIIALQQFGEEIFCAPQEEILEGECGGTYP